MSDLIKRLEDEQLDKSRSSFDCASCGIAANLVAEVIDEIEQLQHYKDFAMKCATVNNHEGWQGKYFREAQRLFLETTNTQQGDT